MRSPVKPVPARSLLDRLLDDEPDQRVERIETRQGQLRASVEALRRDLEALLNARCCPTTPPRGLPELQRSLLTYGTSDFTMANLLSRDQRERFARQLEQVVLAFEPRFRSLAVTVLDPRNSSERVLRLRIEALAILQEETLPIVLSTELNPVTLRFAVADTAHA